MHTDALLDNQILMNCTLIRATGVSTELGRGRNPRFAPMQALAMQAVHFTGADLTALVREAGLAALSVRSNLYAASVCGSSVAHLACYVAFVWQTLMTQLAYLAFVAQFTHPHLYMPPCLSAVLRTLCSVQHTIYSFCNVWLPCRNHLIANKLHSATSNRLSRTWRLQDR